MGTGTMTLPKWSIADIQERMFNRALMVSRHRAEIALGVLGPRMNIGALIVGAEAEPLAQLKAKAATAKAEIDGMPGDGDLKKYGYDFATDSFYEKDPYELWQGCAIFQVRGTLMAESGIDPASGATGYDGLGFKARHALDNAAVKGAILDIDSGGGEVIDLLELCSHLRALADKKPLRAIIRGSGCSAAYALAACAGPGQITAAPYSIVGSIGAIMMHADFSKNLEADGIDVTLITSAAHKADATPYAPLPDDVAAKLQGMVDACASSFIDHVAAARGQERDALAAQHAAFFSGSEALSLGLVDKFMSWDDSMKEFAAAVNGTGSRPASSAPPISGGASSTKGQSMSEYTQAQLDAAVQTATA
jgi:signal peptide peptidase SppA